MQSEKTILSGKRGELRVLEYSGEWSMNAWEISSKLAAFILNYMVFSNCCNACSSRAARRYKKCYIKENVTMICQTEVVRYIDT